MEKSTKIWVTIIVIIVLLVLAFSIYRYTGAATNQSNECFDSDGGKNLVVKGTVRGVDDRVETDSCMSQWRLKEWYCGIQGDVRSIEETCDCVNGACVE